MNIATTASGRMLDSSFVVGLLAVCGVIGPILFFILLSVARLSRPGYIMFAWYISDLGTGSNAWIQNTNFTLVGLLMALFVLGLNHAVRGGSGAKVGSVFLLLGGLAFAGLGIFTSCPNWCFSGTVHAGLFFFVMISLILGLSLFSRRLRKDSRWSGYARYSFWTGIVSLGALLIFMAGTMADPATMAPTGILGPWVGLHQIILAGLPLVWVEVMAWRLYALARRNSALKIGEDKIAL